MICTTNRCGQNSARCPTPLACGASARDESAIHAALESNYVRAMNAPIRRIEHAGDEPEEFTQGEALTKCESALCFVIGAAAVVVLSFMAVQLWPLVVAAWHYMERT